MAGYFWSGLRHILFCRRRVVAFALTSILAFGFAPSLAQGPVTGPAAEAPPIQAPRNHDYHVEHYRIQVAFNWTEESVSGETTVRFRPLKENLKEIELDAGDMTIHAVRLAGGAPLQFRYEDKQKLYVALARTYPAGASISLAITYSATPKRGLTFIGPSEDEPGKPRQIWSQGESQDNHYWFPCYDYPNDKATSEVIATVEDKYTVISNGALVSVQSDSAHKTKTWHWKMDQPSSSYLISIVVGQYAEVKDHYKDIPFTSYVYANQVEDAGVSIGDIGRMAAFFSDRLRFKYPYVKYAQTTVADFPGGMENITATTMSDTLVHDRRAHLDLSSDNVTSHELAHAWFGDMLTCSDWSELWLNESFSEFFANLWLEQSKGKDDYLYENYRNQQQYLDAWSRGITRPLVTRRYSDPDALFDVYAYQKGAAILTMLRSVLGDEVLRKGISHYVDKYQWRNVETPQFVAAIAEATGKNIQWFIDEWIYKIGHPVFEVHSNYDETAKTVSVTVKQVQTGDTRHPWFTAPDFFITPVDIAITTAAGETIHRVMIDARDKTFTFPAESRPLIVDFDRGNYVVKVVKFERSDSELAYQLLHDSDVMGRVLAAVDLRSRHGETALQALTEAATRDRFWGVRAEALTSLQQFKSEAARAALLAAVKDPDSRIRRIALQGLALLRDPRLDPAYISVINNDQSYFAIAEAEVALGQAGGANAYETLAGALKQHSWQDVVRVGGLTGLTYLKDAHALDSGLAYARRGQPVNVRMAAFRLLAEIGKGNDQVLSLLTAALKEPLVPVRLGAIQSLGALKDTRAIPFLEELSNAPEMPPAAKVEITAAINSIRKQ